MEKKGNVEKEKKKKSRTTPYLEKVIHRISLHGQFVKSLDEISYISTDGRIHLVRHFLLTAPFDRGSFLFFFFPGALFLRP